MNSDLHTSTKPIESNLKDSDWLNNISHKNWSLFFLSFLALFLELMVIRWSPSVVRLIAYYANLMLISSFLGLGLGVLIGKKRNDLFNQLPLLIAVNVTALMYAQFNILPGSGSEHRFYAGTSALTQYIVLIALFLTNAAMFIPIGHRIGRIFESLPPLKAYAWDLLGSLFGTLCFGVFSLKYFSPTLGMVCIAVLVLFMLPSVGRIKNLSFLALSILVVFLCNDRNAFWSPYYYIKVTEQSFDPSWHETNLKTVSAPLPGIKTMQNPPYYSISVNHDFYQPHCTLDPDRYTGELKKTILDVRVPYDLPYVLSPLHRKVLVLGAGGGTDTEVAVLNGAEHVDAVEIDPMLVSLSGKFNPSSIYENNKVSLHIDDARAFLRSASGGYDMVLFGWLDSQALFSSMSNLRLDGYIYTVESMRSAFKLLNENGTLSLSFAAPRDWLRKKLIRMLFEATGKTPLVYTSEGQVILNVARGNQVQQPQTFGRFERDNSLGDLTASTSEPPSDDWPYLYLAGRNISQDYLVVGIILLLISFFSIVLVRGSEFASADFHFLFLGVGFLLLQTKSIGDCCLYFGTTWVVTMIVVTGVLIMVLGANFVAAKIQRFSIKMYLPLIASLVVLSLVGRNYILSLDFIERLLWSILIVPLPIFFAGLIFSTNLRSATNPSALLGANLMGAVIGGFSEYLGMVIGSQNLMLIVIAAYLISIPFCVHKVAN